MRRDRLKKKQREVDLRSLKLRGFTGKKREVSLKIVKSSKLFARQISPKVSQQHKLPIFRLEPNGISG